MIIIGQVSGRESYETHFEIAFEKSQIFTPNYFIDRGEKAWIISCMENKVFARMKYGMVPFWSKKRLLHFEAPVEGSDHPDDERIKKRIILHPSYRRPIRDTRCLIPVDYFILLNELSEPYLFFSTESRPFGLAGLYDLIVGHTGIESYIGFSIITTASVKIASNIGINRFPLVLPVRKYKRWLKPDAHLSEITSLLKPVNDNEVNGYPINRKLFFNKVNSKVLIKSFGDLLRNNDTQDPIEIANFLKSFRYKRGLTHSKNNQDKRMWRS